MARPTTPTFPGQGSFLHATVGDILTISTANRESSSYTHDISYKYFEDSNSAYIPIATGVTTSTDWTIPINLCTKFPELVAGEFKIRTITKNGSTTIGTVIKDLVVYIQTTMVPTLDSMTLSDATGLADTTGVYIKDQSVLRIVPHGAKGVCGSSITYYVVSVSILDTYSMIFTPSEDILIPLDKIGSDLDINVVSIDSRGQRSVSLTTTIDIVSYRPPQITAFAAYRSDGAGNETELGTDIAVRYSGNMTSIKPANVEKNHGTIAVRTREVGTTPWSRSTIYNNVRLDLATPPLYIITNQTAIASGTTKDIDKQYEVELLFSDKVTTTPIRRSFVVTVAQTAMSWGKSGVGVGTIWEEGKGALQVVGGAKDDYRHFDYHDASGRSIQDYIDLNDGVRIETIERASENGLNTPIKSANHNGVLYTTSSLVETNEYFGLTQRFYCNRCANSWTRITDSKTTWGPWRAISNEILTLDVGGIALGASDVAGTTLMISRSTTIGLGRSFLDYAVSFAVVGLKDNSQTERFIVNIRHITAANLVFAIKKIASSAIAASDWKISLTLIRKY